jgi:RNA polymerase sigma-70 factor (ECF subfamily)
MGPHTRTSFDVGCLLDRLAAGDAAARDQLIARTLDHVTEIARRQLHTFPTVRRREQTDDVAQNVVLRVHRALMTVRPTDPRAFFGLCAWHIRKELLQLLRKHDGPNGINRNLRSPPPDASGAIDPLLLAADTTFEPSKLARWTELHETLAALPDEQRAVADLIWYQGFTKVEAAKVLNVSEKTVRRHWIKVREVIGKLVEDGGV